MNHLKTAILLGVCAFCYGCSVFQEPSHQPDEFEKMMKEFSASIADAKRFSPENLAAEAKRRREAYVSAHPELSAKEREAILSGMIWIGMTTEQAEASCGKPFSGVNSTVTSRGTHEQWVYDDTYLYFDNGVLTSFQKFHQ